MSSMLKSTLVMLSLIAAFYVSVSYRYGEPGWRVELRSPTAAARGGAADEYDLRRLQILNRAVIQIKENYVDPSRINERKMIGAAMEEVQRAVAELLVEVARDAEGVPTSVTIHLDSAQATFDISEVGNLWQMSFRFKDIFQFIQDNLKQHKNLQDIEYAAINGMLSTLDPHSVLLRPEDYREMKLSTRGKFGGLGIVISVREGTLTIVNPIEDTPADRAGLKAGDRIVQIGLDSTVNMALSDAVDMLRGEPNTKVDIWVVRDGWPKPRKFTLTRADIKVKSVAHRRLTPTIGVVRIRNFQHTTHDELKAALRTLAGKGKLQGLVLDLRGNPGGLLDQAIKVSDLFVSSGPLVTTVGFGDKMREPKMATRSGTESVPVVVLTDASSASASEIVAGALKNHKRAVVIGQQTFGKGSVQVIYDNKDDSALKLTIAQYLTPGDLSIQSVGIVPDILTQPVVLTESDTDLYRSIELRGGEKDLPAHLDHASAEVSKALKPELILRHLQDEALVEKIESNPNELIVDFEIELAQRILEAAPVGDRDGMLEQARPALDALIGEQEARIVAALAARGVDWSTPTVAAGAPRAAITVTTDAPDNRVTAGEKVTLTVDIENTGDAPFVRLRGLLRSDNEPLDGHEVLFGTFGPGERRSAKVTVELPKSALARRDPVRLELKEARDQVPPVTSTKIAVVALLRPRLAFTYQVDDAKGGNGDGILQVGEEADLVLEVENLGEGASETVLGSLRNDDKAPARSLFIKRGRVEHKAGLLPGAKAELRFRFKAKEGLPRATHVPMLLAVLDAQLREGTTEKAFIPVFPADQVVTPAKAHLRPLPGRELEIRSAPHAQAPVMASAGDLAQADAQVGDWWRVPLESGRFGWIATASAAKESPGAGRIALRRASPKGPPVIRLTGDAVANETSADALTLSGEVLTDKWVQDLLIYVNNKKVFFKANPVVSGQPQPMRFSARVPLDEGVNRITLIAREDEDASSRRTVIVHRGP